MKLAEIESLVFLGYHTSRYNLFALTSSKLLSQWISILCK